MRILRALVLAGVAAFSAGAASAEFRKSYFTATTPGSWAKYSVSFGGPPTMEYTYRRLPDEKGSARIEFTMEYTSGPPKGKRFVYVSWIKPGFSLEKNAWSYGKWVTRMTTQQGSEKPKESSAGDLEAIKARATDYNAASSFVDTATVDGKTCDHYSYKWSPPGKPPSTETGNLWLNESVPFGVVRSDLTIKSPAGATISAMETKLVASSVDPAGFSRPRQR